MELQVGNVIEVHSNKVGTPPRRGEVVEVPRGDTDEVRVAWDDGHESLFLPAGGMVRVVQRSS